MPGRDRPLLRGLIPHEAHQDRCCGRDTPLTGRELGRLCRALGVDPELVAAGEPPALMVQRAASGDCRFLLRLPSGRLVCGAGTLAPHRCRGTGASETARADRAHHRSVLASWDAMTQGRRPPPRPLFVGFVLNRSGE